MKILNQSHSPIPPTKPTQYSLPPSERNGILLKDDRRVNLKRHFTHNHLITAISKSQSICLSPSAGQFFDLNLTNIYFFKAQNAIKPKFLLKKKLENVKKSKKYLFSHNYLIFARLILPSSKPMSIGRSDHGGRL